MTKGILEMNKFILLRFVQYIMLHDYSYRTAEFYPIFDQCIFLYSKCTYKCCCASVATSRLSPVPLSGS